MSNDPLSDILRMTEAKAVVSGAVSAGGRWAIHVVPRAQIVFAAIAQGACWLRLDGRKRSVRLEQGDVGLLSGREGFVLCSSLAVPAIDVPPADRWGETFKIGDGSGCTWLVGKVALQAASAFRVAEALPAMIHVRGSTPGAASLRWIVHELIEEQRAQLAGASIASAQLAQLFFVKILRAHLASAGALPSGWLRAVSDQRIAEALRVMHSRPGRDFRLSELASAAGMSRTRFAVRFKSVAGVPPLTYLTAWRMLLAQRALRDEDTSILELGASLGYASESAFSNAFKRVTGAAPRDYRRSARA